MSSSREGQGTGSGVSGGSGDSGDSGSESGPDAAEEWAVAAGAKSRRSATKVVLDHVGRQKSLPAHRLDPVGARDDRQRPPEGPGPAGHLPPVDELRPSPRASPGPQDGNGDLSDSGTDLSDGAAAGSVPAWHGPVAAAMPSSTAGYGTRAEVVARLPASIMLLRHAECLTLDELQAHERVPNHDIPLSELGVEQARQLGQRLRPALQASGMCLYMYTSPFLRCAETARILQEELEDGGLVSGVREAVQLREQDWGNFQDPRVQAQCKEERLRYGRFYYRFPSGESVADVYDRLTIFQDHLVRDMCAGRFSENTSLAIVSHGLTLRVFAMRWLHWTVRQFLQVYNIPNAEPVVMHKEVDPHYLAGDNAQLPFMPHHTKCLYRLTPRALELLKGVDLFMASPLAPPLLPPPELLKGVDPFMASPLSPPLLPPPELLKGADPFMAFPLTPPSSPPELLKGADPFVASPLSPPPSLPPPELLKGVDPFMASPLSPPLLPPRQELLKGELLKGVDPFMASPLSPPLLPPPELLKGADPFMASPLSPPPSLPPCQELLKGADPFMASPLSPPLPPPPELLKGADPFMASSSSCFQGPRLASRAQARPDEEETRRQWADVDGMV
ncbi:hypothetical protein HYH03_009536 [Edaphochlamys debaryana]|uniref:Uncharacterized protein n=1 Tax=Edaphochlamys debaryana TaxID=47281 RepID=A0A836BX27_9CHLO|nr:hypothetical protein HYH03_009536 [Edaphochlamys debaryana]|eukprot:KAG2492296.1 hypothetical protein HYH03_009536 [Edaphochlamys debaryana]